MDDWRTYDDVAQVYERVHAPRFAEPARDLVRLAEIAPGDRVLDVGTGTGVAAQAAVDAGAQAVGVDPSVEMLQVARSARPGLRIAAAGALDLPFRAGVFDAVVGNFVLAHFTKIDTALFDVLRVTRSGGRVAFSTWAGGPDIFQQTWNELIEGVVPREVLATAIGDAVPGHDRLSRRDAVQQTLHDAGLRHVRTESARYRWIYSIDEYIAGISVWAVGRFTRGMLGPAGWESFLSRARATFAERFPDPMQDFRDVILSVGTKE
jgi:ubiquinone/menaquinone biosynthesis C-methylase UbiE